MSRWGVGNVMLVAGHDELELEAKHGEVVRFYFTNTANTRVFNVTVPGARMKLVGADSGHYEREELVDEVLSLRPSASSSTFSSLSPASSHSSIGRRRSPTGSPRSGSWMTRPSPI